MLKPTSIRHFMSMLKNTFIQYITRKPENVTKLDLVWDFYLPDSLKTDAKAKSRKGVQICVLASAVIPGNWHNFLSVDFNWIELVSLWCFDLGVRVKKRRKTFFFLHKWCRCSQQATPLRPVGYYTPCTNEEADSRTLLHVAHDSINGHQKIMLQTIGTNVVLAVAVYRGLQSNNELWLVFSTGKALLHYSPWDCSRTRASKDSFICSIQCFGWLWCSVKFWWTWTED